MKRFLFTALAPVFVAGSLNAASDYLLEIDGIKGESSDARHSEVIEIESFSWGASNSTAGGGSGKVSFSDLHFTMKLTKATPQILLACATGAHIPKARLYVRKAGAAEDYYTITFTDVLVSSLKQSGRNATSTLSDSTPADEGILYFNQVTIAHTATDGTVTTGEAVRTPVQ